MTSRLGQNVLFACHVVTKRRLSGAKLADFQETAYHEPRFRGGIWYFEQKAVLPVSAVGPCPAPVADMGAAMGWSFACVGLLCAARHTWCLRYISDGSNVREGVGVLGKTHVCAGVAVSLVALQPSSVAGLMCVAAGGALGGWIPDVDVRGAKLARGTIASACVVAMAFAGRLLAELLRGINVLGEVASPMGAAGVVGSALFAAVTIIGSFASHRGFTHSLLGCALWYFAMSLLWPQLAPSFGVGLCSHLALDLLNCAPKGSMQLFFPFKPRVCLGLCQADGLVNSLVWVGSCIVSVVYIGCFLMQAFQ